MDGTTLELPLFLLATFAGAVVAGLTGFAFAFGLVIGMKMFGRLDEATFRKIVLALLVASGALLVRVGRHS